ncbi:MAG: hypothetical protein JW959_06110 [Pirellulales bacterium]|nr:hypothetical protein [Pirellulales bacterium]
MFDDNGIGRSHQAAAIETRPAKRKKRRPWRLPLTLALLAALIWLLPAIVANSPLPGWIVRKAAADLNGTVSIRSTSLGWFAPAVASGVEVKDAAGNTVLSVPSISSERSLAGMLRDWKNIGRIHVSKPKIFLELDDEGSNVEELLANYLAPREAEEAAKEAPTSAVGFSLRIDDAEVTIVDRASGKNWQIRALSLELDAPRGAAGAIGAKLSAELLGGEKPGKLVGEARIEGGVGESAVNAANVPLAMFRAAAARFAPGTTLSGLLSSSARAAWGGNAEGGNHLQADLNLQSFLLTAPELQTDRLALDRAHGACKISWTGNRVDIEQTTLDCDVGSFLVKGTIPLDEEGQIGLESLLAQRQEFDGRLDIARLARLLPATLHIRQGMRIDSGQVRLCASCRPEPRGTVWQGQLQASGLAADAGGRRIEWRQPVMASVEAHQGPDGPVIDALRCESDFLKFHAAGTADRLAGSLTFSLNRLTEQLGQFVDLAGLHLAGEGSGSLHWNRNAQRLFEAGAQFSVNNFQLATAGKRAWIEPNMTLSLTAAGQTDLGENTRIDAAAISLKTAADRIDAKLTGAVVDPTGGPWPVRLDMRGNLRNWPARLAPWMPTDDWRLTGDYVLAAEATATDDDVFLRQLTVSAVPLKVASKSFNADEPRLDANASGSWEGKQRRLRIERAGLACGTLAVGANNLLVSMPESGTTEMSGSLTYQTFLGRLKQWFADPAAPPAWRLAGQLKGSVQFQQAGKTIRGSTDAEVLNLAVADSSGQKFTEPVVKLSAEGNYDAPTKVVQLAKFELTSSVLAAIASGRYGPVGDHREAQIDGRMRYDVGRLAEMMRPYLGPGVLIVGRGESPFGYRGPLSLASGTAAAAMDWDRANVYGFQIGPGSLQTEMADGLLKIRPLDLSVSGGRMHLAPQARLSPGPTTLTLPAGPLMEKVQIDPAMCASFLQYIAPVLADATSAQGSFSIAMDRCRVPLSEPKKSDLAGRFVVHSVQIGPGPLIRELAVLLGRESPARLRQESVVAFQMKNGRVHHDNLELIFPDLTIRTHGSVGLDKTLDLVAEMPVPPKWLAGNPIAAKALANQVVRIPLKGTLAKPQLDRREMERLSRQFIKKAAGNLLEEELNKQLERLLGPRK